MAFYKNWGKKQYEIAKKYKWAPVGLLAGLGETFFVWYYKISLVVLFVFFTAWYISQLVKFYT
jgi:hypothetical protein